MRSVRKSVAIALAISTAASAIGPGPNGSRASGEARDARGVLERHAAIEEALDLAVANHALGERTPAGALARAEHRPDQRKMPEGCTSSQGVRSARCCRFKSARRGSR